MAPLIPDQHCDCGSVLIPRRFASGTPPPDADYICLRCGAPYRWSGTPPHLLPVSAAHNADDDDDDG